VAARSEAQNPSWTLESWVRIILEAYVYYSYVFVLSFVASGLDRLCGLVVTVSGYRTRGPGFDSLRV
jgi:hypothetical protein